ncbi:MAG: DNA-directed RNA polymerase subunit omega [Planctomycetota bacterium]|jgi:DNA-directed RNA polymerase subunit omega
MIEELKDNVVVNKVGGRFKMSALIQKRMVELIEGGRPLITDTEGMTTMEIVIEEIKQDKIVLDETGDEPKPKPAELL